jgi:gamma-glutamyltranspeptidase / glutathione hydrolase
MPTIWFSFMRSGFLWFAALVILSVACKGPAGREIQKHSLSKKGMIVSANQYATEAGLSIMQQGGNAVDAAIAVHFALAVTYPRAGNLGGGGFLMYRDSAGQVQSLDFREKAPSASTRNMFIDSLGKKLPDVSEVGALSVGVPGSVAGMWEMHALLKPSLPWEKLLQPAIRLARDGFPITLEEATRLNEIQSTLKALNPPNCPFIKSNGWEEGDILQQEDLAITLEQIAIAGKKAFYEGGIANAISQRIQELGGIMTSEDLANYDVKWRDPVKGKYRQFELYSMGPPSGGGTALLQIAGILERFSLDKEDPTSPYNVHLYCEAARSAFQDRAQWMGDPDFVKIPFHRITSQDYLQRKMQDYSPDKARKSNILLPAISKETYETTHYTVVDHAGRCVSITTTLNSNYGSLVWVPSAGFFLNNEMDDFSSAPNQPNQFGLVGSVANEIQPNKRMLSSMSPTIVTRDGKLFLALGSPGGPTIVPSVWQTIMYVIDLEMELKDAVATGRYHHQWVPDEIVLEKNIATSALIQALKSKGHNVREVSRMGAVNAVKRHENGMLEGVADPRDQSHTRGL